MRTSVRARPAAEFGQRALLLTVAFWTLFGALQASTWLLSPDVAAWSRQAGRVLASALANASVWALLTPFVFRLADGIVAERRARVRRVAVVLALGLVVAAGTATFAAAVHRQLIPPRPRAAPTTTWTRLPPMARWYFQQCVTFGGVLLVGIAAASSRRYREREREAARLAAEASRLQTQSAELQAQLAEARLAALRTRLNPHFLFNTLNAVSALVARDPRGVRDMIALLSELLRHALADTREQEISLRRELDLLRLYLEILTIRYQGQLRTVVDAVDAVQDALVPNLVLQPLVENAMKHAVEPAGGHGTIEVRACRAGDALVLTVRDTGPGDAPPAPTTGGGVGLRLTRDRLAELYGGDQRLTLEPAPDGGTTARVVLPYHTRAAGAGAAAPAPA